MKTTNYMVLATSLALCLGITACKKSSDSSDPGYSDQGDTSQEVPAPGLYFYSDAESTYTQEMYSSWSGRNAVVYYEGLDALQSDLSASERCEQYSGQSTTRPYARMSFQRQDYGGRKLKRVKRGDSMAFANVWTGDNGTMVNVRRGSYLMCFTEGRTRNSQVYSFTGGCTFEIDTEGNSRVNVNIRRHKQGGLWYSKGYRGEEYRRYEDLQNDGQDRNGRDSRDGRDEDSARRNGR